MKWRCVPCSLACDDAGIRLMFNVYVSFAEIVQLHAIAFAAAAANDDGDTARGSGGRFCCHAYASGSNVLITIIVSYWLF